MWQAIEGSHLFPFAITCCHFMSLTVLFQGRNFMLWIFRAITDRLKALFVSDVALEFETQFIARQS